MSTAVATNPRTESVIDLKRIAKVFCTDEVETHALSGVDISISKGEYVAVAGPSGCGKSTLLSIMGLLDAPTGGTYRLKGRPVQDLGPNDLARIRNREIGFIFQSFNLIGDISVFENVALPLFYSSESLSIPDQKQRVQEVLELVGMTHRINHYPTQLSGGQQQRIAVARALVVHPAILLADEPTGNLDSQNSEMVMELLQDLNRRGTTICMVTHDQRYARHASRTINLLDGRVVKEAASISTT